MPDVVIIGGGITGAAAAYEIARAGHSVTLVEKRRLAAMASGWTLGGVRQSGRDPAELPLAREAVKRWATLDDELGAPIGYRRRGNLRLARTEEETQVIRVLVDGQRAQGLDLDYLSDNAAVRAVAPAIGPDILAASFCPTDGHADPVSAVRAFVDAARRHGADIREGVAACRLIVSGETVKGVETDDGVINADRVILATGVHAPELLRSIGLDLPLIVKLVCVLQSVPVAPMFEQVFGVANADCAGRQEIDGRFRVTTGIGEWQHDVATWSEDSLQPTAGDIARLIDLTTKVLPIIGATGVAKVWGGLIDLTPDGLPAIDARTGLDGLVVAAGFSGHGFGIGPAVGEILCDLALGRQPRFDLAPFQLARFKDARAAADLSLHG